MKVDFPYFADPDNFAYLTSPNETCDGCGAVGVCFDDPNFYGTKNDEILCPACLAGGKLAELHGRTNELEGELKGSPEEQERLRFIIERCTPALPTWQDCLWPVEEGEPCRFIKIASQADYEVKGGGQAAAKSRFTKSLREDTVNDPDWLWGELPKTPIRNLEASEKNVVSAYLFTHGTKFITIWDADDEE